MNNESPPDGRKDEMKKTGCYKSGKEPVYAV